MILPFTIMCGTLTSPVTTAFSLSTRVEINGDVTYKVLEIAAGAQVNGSMSRMGEKGEVVPLKSVDSGRGEAD